MGTDLDLGDVPLTAEQLTRIRTRRLVGISIKNPKGQGNLGAEELRGLLGDIAGIGPNKPVVNLFSGTPYGDSSLLNLRRFACSHLTGSFAALFLAEPPLAGLRSLDLTNKEESGSYFTPAVTATTGDFVQLPLLTDLAFSGTCEGKIETLLQNPKLRLLKLTQSGIDCENALVELGRSPCASSLEILHLDEETKWDDQVQR
jgi:hypothetical protein